MFSSLSKVTNQEDLTLVEKDSIMTLTWEEGYELLCCVQAKGLAQGFLFSNKAARSTCVADSCYSCQQHGCRQHGGEAAEGQS